MSEDTPTPSPWEPLRRLSRWPLLVLMAFLGLFGLLACRLAFALAPHGTATPAALLLFVTLCALGIRKAYRFEKALAERQATGTSEALSDFVLMAWVNEAKRELSPEDRWLTARPRLRLVAMVGFILSLCFALACFDATATEHLHHYFDRRWTAPLALYAVGVFFELFRCASKLSPGNTQLAEAMEHYRRFHNHGLILAFAVVWTLFWSILM